MKIISFLSLSLFSFSLYGAMGSSVSIPTQEHLKYTFGNHKNHPVQKLEERQYLHSLAPMDEQAITRKLAAHGYTPSRIQLCDVTSELVYKVDATDTQSKHMQLFVDPTNGSILKTKLLP